VKYRTIVADPPWRYPMRERAKSGPGLGGRRAAEHQYGVMNPEDIAAIPVRDWVDRDAHLYLWVTNLMLKEGRPFDILDAWGFRFATMLTWHKLGAPGMGFYFRGDTEHVLLGVRGTCPIEPAMRISNHFAAPRTGHSAKPDRFYEIVERVSPEPRLELFARRRRVGWDVWGNEAPPESEARTQTHLGLTA
jgi:N6-adenosine-specific RNA methylase IME4